MIHCAYCKKAITGPNYKTYQKRRYHYECFAAMRALPANAAKPSAQSSNDPFRTTLEEYIASLYGCPQLPASVCKQIDSMSSQYGYSCFGMQQALEYFYKIQGKPLPAHITIGIVPWCYEEAQAYFSRIKRANQHNANVPMQQITVTAKVKPPDRRLPCSIRIEDL